jgi:hypothetical protein
MLGLGRFEGFQLADLSVDGVRQELDDVVVDALRFHDVGQAFELDGKAAQFQGERLAFMLGDRQRCRLARSGRSRPVIL